MRFISEHRRAPDEAVVVCLIRVERHRATDDGASRDWSEVTTVETVANIRIHQEEVTGRDAPAAVPNWQFAPRSIGGTRATKRHGINNDGAISRQTICPETPITPFSNGAPWRDSRRARRRSERMARAAMLLPDR